METRRRLTLGQVFALALVAQAVALAALFWLVFSGSREALIRSAAKLHVARSESVAARVAAGLSQAEDAVEEVEKQLRFEVARTGDVSSVERTLFGALLHRDNLIELTFTFDGGQVSLLRVPDGGGFRYVTRYLHPTAGRWMVERRDRPMGGTLTGTPLQPTDEVASDPTAHPTYTTPLRFRQAIWSDLSFSSLDEMLPPERRRKVMTVQRAIYGGHGELLGVARAGLVDRTIDSIGGKAGVFICDRQGRLITRLSPEDRYATVDAQGAPDPDGDVRVVAASIPPPVAAALADPALASLEEPIQHPIRAGGKGYLLTLRGLERTQGWVVGVVVPEEEYLQGLAGARDQLLLGSAGLMALLLVGALLLLRGVRRDLRRVVVETERMRRFEFAPGGGRSAFRDVQAALDSLERAKTALRALGKYAPTALVRQLYDAQREPTLGGELQDVTVSFSDIEGFTALAEAMTPDELAQALGRYLEAMTDVIQAHGGTIDKYVGDAVMALWNTPRPVERHPLAACRAALRCLDATGGMFPTRVGIHRDTVMVGHFGAPTRFSFTAIGDGVNLASRLEGLNKQYGTRILVSDAVAREVAGEMVLRRLDRVAVVGKHRAVDIYELCGRVGEVIEDRRARLARYEAGLELYLAGKFAEAAAALDGMDDGPSRVLCARCRVLVAAPPERWEGIYAAVEK